MLINFYMEQPNTKLQSKNTMKWKILIVEDDIYSFLLLKSLLKHLQPIITWAKTGKEALNIIRNNGGFDIVLMDIALPDISGYKLTENIKKMYPDLIIIAQTAHALYGDRDKCLKAGCDDYISKPIQKNIFYNILEKWGINEKELESSVSERNI